MSETSSDQPEVAPAFIIRAHHMESIQLILLGQISPGQTATAIFKTISSNADNDPKNKTYYDDVYGPNDEAVGRVIQSDHAFFQAFLDLPDDAPVTISPAKDAICDNCFTGAHCTDVLPDSESKDFVYFNHFLTIASRVGLRDDTYNYINLPQADPKKSVYGMRIETTAAVARTVIGHPDFADYQANKAALEEEMEKQRRRWEKADKREDMVENVFTKINHGLYKLRRVRPAAALFAIYAAGNILVHIGEAVEAVHVHDTYNVTSDQATELLHESDKALNTLQNSFLELAGAGLALIIIPRRRIDRSNTTKIDSTQKDDSDPLA